MSPRGVAIVAFLVTGAGCAGLGGPAPTDTTAGTTAPTTATSTLTTTTTTAPTSASTTTTTTISDTTVVAYETLSTTDQRFFLDLLENDSLVAPPPVGIRNLTGESDVGDEGSVYVRYRGALYEVSYRGGGIYGRYTPHVEAVNRSEGDLTVTPYENLSVRAKSVFRTAIAGETPERGYADEVSPRNSRATSGTTGRSTALR